MILTGKGWHWTKRLAGSLASEGNIHSDLQTWNNCTLRCQWRHLRWEPQMTQRDRPWRKGCWITSANLTRKRTRQNSPLESPSAHLWKYKNSCLHVFLPEEWKEKLFWVSLGLELWNVSAAQWSIQHPTADSLSPLSWGVPSHSTQNLCDPGTTVPKKRKWALGFFTLHLLWGMIWWHHSTAFINDTWNALDHYTENIIMDC